MRFDPCDRGLAATDNVLDDRAAHFRFAAVEPMEPPIGITRLSTAFSLNGNPRLDFRTHLNPENCTPPLFGRFTGIVWGAAKMCG